MNEDAQDELRTDAPEYLTSAALNGALHGFFTRKGGVSRGDLASLNCGLGSGDDTTLIAENRARACAAATPGCALLGVHQYHSAEVVVADRAWPDDTRPKADALVTRQTGLALAILTADCAPVLLHEPEAGVIGAAHAGWRGAAKGVIAATVEAMTDLGARAKNIRAAIGPCIAQQNYEVGEDMRGEFAADDLRFFIAQPPSGGNESRRWLFDLEGYVASRLESAGLTEIERLGADTYGDEARFYSFRRASHRGENSYGRQISVIALGARLTPGKNES